MNSVWRLFIAIELPPEARKAVGQLQAELKKAFPQRAIRWTSPDSIHLTLKFLGDVDTDRLAEIASEIKKAVNGKSSFGLDIDGLGCFPDVRRPRIVWVGISRDTKALRILQNSVEKHIAPLGFPAEERGFSPHLTIGRIDRGASREDEALIGKIVQETDVEILSSWQVKSISLMRSQLRPEGAQYTQVTEINLVTE